MDCSWSVNVEKHLVFVLRDRILVFEESDFKFGCNQYQKCFPQPNYVLINYGQPQGFF